MMVRLDNLNNISIQSCFIAIVWTSLITGCWSTGLRTARSPGVTIPHFVTSNGLGDRNYPPNPASSPDYDYLLENVNGDFGFKSSFLKAATEDPVYTGTETKLLPLYIPKGAIPIKLARITRSGSDSSGSSLRINLRRSRLPSSITSRRQGGPRRPNPPPAIPASTPSFLRGWGRRIAPRAESRLGLEVEDSKTSASTQSHTLKRPGFQRTSSGDLSNRSIQSSRRTTSTTETPTTITTTLKTTSPVPQPSIVVSTTQLKNNFSLNSTVTSTTENSLDEKTNKESVSSFEQADKPFGRQRKQDFVEIKPDALRLDFKSNRTNSRVSSAFIRQVSAGESSQLRQSRTSTTESTVENDAIQTLEVDNKKIEVPRITTFQRIRETIQSRVTSDDGKVKNVEEGETENDPASVRTNINNKRFLFPTRPTTPKSDTEESVGSNDSNNERKSGKFRMPLLSLKSSNVEDNKESAAEASALRETSSETGTQNASSADSKSPTPSPLPVRRRRPLRTRLPLVEANSNNPNFASFRHDILTSRSRSTTTTTTDAPEITTSTTPRITASTTTELTTSHRPLLFRSTPSTTTANVRRIHDFFKISADNDKFSRKTTTTTTTTTIPPRLTTTTEFSVILNSTTQRSTIYPTTNFWHKSANRKGSHSARPPKRVQGNPQNPSSKSAAEIVLASLSEVMKDVSTDDMDKIKKIASDLDTLNKKLSERGILIIHAEVDGMIINLRNQTAVKNRDLFRNRRTKLGQRENSSVHENEKENLQPQLLAGSDDASTTIYTPSDKLNYDVLNNQNQRTQNQDKILYNIPSEKVNELSTTKVNKDVSITTDKPKIDRLPTISPFSSELATEYDKETVKDKNMDEIISVTPTLPSIETTRSRTTSIPLGKHKESTKVSLEIDYISSDDSETTESGKIEIFSNSEILKKAKNKMETNVILDSENNSGVNIVLKSNKVDSSYSTDGTDWNYISDHQEADDFDRLNNELLSDFSNEEEQVIEEEENSSSVYLVGMVGIFPLAGVAAYIVRKYLRGDTHKKALPDSEERPDGFTPPTHHHARTQSLLPPLPTDHPPKPSISCAQSSDSTDSGIPPSLLNTSPWEFSRSKLRLVSILGEGNFGVVWKAEARGFCDYASGGSTVLVAVKRVKDTAGAKEKCDLLRELSVMQLLGPHPNVVSLLGCCTESEPHLVIMEYVMFGKLLTFLRDHRTRHNYFNFSSDTAALTSRDLTRFACQIATGCDYLQSRGIIHRDLAARNILVDHNKVCKIADFGMARSVQDIGSDIYEQKSKGALPIRWMAPESLYMNIFTHKSDVWSFGILCWEIVTLGSTPYPGLTAREVMRQVTEGYRLERPDHCGPELYRLLATCWQQDLNKRPTFHQLKIELSTLMEHHTGYIDLENFPEEDYFSMHQNNDEKL